MRADRLSLWTGFLHALGSYWLDVFPLVADELRRARSAALAIPDPQLRDLALQALAKQGNMEGAAAFATFAPRAHRATVVRATVAFQTAYNHLDTVSEQSAADPQQNSRCLHRALLVALDPGAQRHDYYAHSGHDDDGGYLTALVDVCRQALVELPAYASVAPAALRAAERVAAFQVLQASSAAGGDGEGGGDSSAAPTAWSPSPDGELHWWEMAASAGSSLGVHVMIAAAAERQMSEQGVLELESAYFPWIGALHSMLDHLVDVEEDRRTGQRNLIALYGSSEQAAKRMGHLAEMALARAGALVPAARHQLILAAMASFYLSRPQASAPEALPITQAVIDALGSLTPAPLAVFRSRSRLERMSRAFRARDTEGAPIELSARRRGSSRPLAFP